MTNNTERLIILFDIDGSLERHGRKADVLQYLDITDWAVELPTTQQCLILRVLPL